MTRYLTASLLALWASTFTVLLHAQTEDFRIQLEPIEIPGLNAVHSAVIVAYDNHILAMGGRTDGLHRRQPFAAFQASGSNPEIQIANPVSKQVWTATLTGLPVAVSEQLLSTNLQFTTDGPWLYMVGGYGYSPAAGAHVTHDKLMAVHLDSLINAVQNAQPIAGLFHQIQDERFAVTGGYMALLDGLFYLVGGHRFDGQYNPMNHPTFTQTYTNAIRRFSVQNPGSNLTATFMPEWNDPVNLHRRDYNMAPQVFPDGRIGLTAFSGVFQQFVDLPYLNTVDIDTAGYNVNNTFQHRLNQYHCAHATLYDPGFNRMHTVFFGGIAQFFLDEEDQLIQDDNVPFVNTIGRVTRLNDGSMVEEKIGEMPGLLGAGAEFVSASDIPVMANGIVDLQAITADTLLLGYLVGGIESELPNVFFNNQDLSDAQSVVFGVKWIRTQGSTGVRVPPAHSMVGSVSVQPNPVRDIANILFTLREKAPVSISMQAPDGRLIVAEELGVLSAGEQRFQFRLEQFPAGVYPVTLTVGQEIVPVKVVVIR